MKLQPDKIFVGTELRKTVTLDKALKLGHALLRTLWLLSPEFNFWKEDWGLIYALTQIWDFSGIS